MLEDKKGVTETEDTQNEQDAEDSTENAEDTTENADSTSEQDNSEDSSSEQSSDDKVDKKLFFMDPDKLPKEIVPHFKKMQAAFTRKMQLVSGVAKKAQAWDSLIADPDVRAVIDRKYGTGKGKATETDDEDGDSVDAKIEEKVEERVAPIERERAQEKIKAEFKEFSEKYPFYKNYENELRDYLNEHPNATFREGLAAVAMDDLLSLVGTDIVQKKKANITRPNRGTSLGKGSSQKQAKTIQEAFAMAKAEQGVK